MPYNNAVPQANQTIAQTRAPILGNFAFLQTDLQQDHQFNTGVTPDGIHKQCSMANQTSPTISGNINGTYYVKNSQPWFKSDGGADYNISNPTLASFGPFSGSISVPPGTTALVPNITGNVGGMITYWKGILPPSTSAYSFWQLTGTSNLAALTSSRFIAPTFGGDDLRLSFNATVLSLQNTSGTVYTIHYFGWTYPTV